ncbi:hypothetical protein R3P38DRAFT_2809534 [Favolaschia claudopus]|uniref:F-box domain-containing protein n=1 Tax=Favolaschia claudopus TaxID=2862362 RepID=A0AAV9ZE01_9AGAR
MLVSLPTDVLGLIFQLLYDQWFCDYHPKFRRSRPHFSYERCAEEYLVALSCSCRQSRAQTLPWIFREVYNWDSSRGRVWPESLWPYFKIVHIRDYTVQTDLQPWTRRKLDLSPETVRSLSMMPFLSKATIRLESSIPSDLLHALSQAPSLLCLEVHQARFDGTFPSTALAFSTLETLLISTAGFNTMVKQDDIDPGKQAANVASLLTAVSHRLTELAISGDFISCAFTAIKWPQIRRLAITDHPPTQPTPVLDLVAKMPQLRDLQVVYTTGLTHDPSVFPPIQLGDNTRRVLSDSCPLLSSLTLGNVLSDDLIFAQLPPTLDVLDLRAPVDPYDPDCGFPRGAYFPLDQQITQAALSRMRYLSDLKELCFDLDSFVTAPFIEHIAVVLPHVEILEFDVPRYVFMSSPRRFDEQNRDPALLVALNRFPRLQHLRIAMNFPRKYWDPECSREVTAKWFLLGVRSLQTVSFASPKHLWSVGYKIAGWQEWDHGVIHFRVPTPTPPTRFIPSRS